MAHQGEISNIIAQVTPWPVEDRVALAYQILSDMRTRTRKPAPRKTLESALGIASGTSTAPDDLTVQQWVDERRLKKHG